MTFDPEVPPSPTLDPEALDPDPVRQLAAWVAEAAAAGIDEAQAMALASASPDGAPSVRFLLARSIDQGGILFYTDYESRKARELDANPRAAAAFYWDLLGRQARVSGRAERVSEAESRAYFDSRPLGSRLAATVSRQGQPLASRDLLDRAYAAAEVTYANGDLPLPPTWGGYRLLPETVEFWQSRPNRLHDRLLYLRQAAGGWRVERLSP